ncbi:MAG: hypothetical protein H7Y38_07520 [Armatimonadetes bacterium]|nr:hypothetical protein [Armatimonadota bacterium]
METNPPPENERLDATERMLSFAEGVKDTGAGAKAAKAVSPLPELRRLFATALTEFRSEPIRLQRRMLRIISDAQMTAGDYQDAIATASAIEEPEHREVQLRRIVAKLADRCEFDLALKTVGRLQDRDRSLCDIAYNMAKVGEVERAYLLSEDWNGDIRDVVLAGIVSFLFDNGRAAEGSHYIPEISRGSSRLNALKDQAIGFANESKPDEAIRIAESIELDLDRLRLLLRIAATTGSTEALKRAEAYFATPVGEMLLSSSGYYLGYDLTRAYIKSRSVDKIYILHQKYPQAVPRYEVAHSLHELGLRDELFAVEYAEVEKYHATGGIWDSDAPEDSDKYRSHAIRHCKRKADYATARSLAREIQSGQWRFSEQSSLFTETAKEQGIEAAYPYFGDAFETAKRLEHPRHRADALAELIWLFGRHGLSKLFDGADAWRTGTDKADSVQ